MTMTMIPCNFSFFAALLWQVGECVWHEPAKYKYELVSWWKRYFIKHFKAQNFINHEWLATTPYPLSKYIFKLNPSICSENTFYIIVTTFAEKNQILLWKKSWKYANTWMSPCNAQLQLKLKKWLKFQFAAWFCQLTITKKGNCTRRCFSEEKKVTMKLKI